MAKTFYKSCRFYLLLLMSCLVIPSLGGRSLATPMEAASSVPETLLENDDTSSIVGDDAHRLSEGANTVDFFAPTAVETIATVNPEPSPEPSTSTDTAFMAETINVSDAAVLETTTAPEATDNITINRVDSVSNSSDQSIALRVAQAKSMALKANDIPQEAQPQVNILLPIETAPVEIAQTSPAVNAEPQNPATIRQVTTQSVIDTIETEALEVETTEVETTEVETTEVETTEVETGEVATILPNPNASEASVDNEADVEPAQVAQNITQTNPGLGELSVPGLPNNSLATRARLGTPASSISTPLAFGAQQGNVYSAVGYQARTRGIPGPETSGKDDGGFTFGFGVGDPREDVALEIGVTSVSTFRRTPLSAGTVSLKFHHLIEEDLAVAAGIENLIRWGTNDGGTSVYGVMTRRFRLTESPNDMFSTLTVSGGIGTGRFRSVSDIRNDRRTFNAFGSASLQVAPPVSVIADWSGQDLGLGMSVAPFANIPLTVNAAVVDLTGNADSDPRFVMGVGYGFNF